MFVLLLAMVALEWKKLLEFLHSLKSVFDHFVKYIDE